MRILPVLIACLAFTSSSAQRSAFNLDHPATMEGKIRNYKPGNENRFFTLRTFDIGGRSKDTAVEIKPDGSFFIRFTSLSAIDIQIGYRGTFITLLHRLGERFTLEIDDRAWTTDLNKAPAIEMSGELGAVSDILINYMYAVSQHAFKTQVDWRDKSKSDEEVVNIRLQRMREELQFLDDYIRAGKAKNPRFSGPGVHPLFSAWAKSQVIYEAGHETVFTLFTGSRHRTYTHSQLIGLLKNFPLGDMAPKMNSVYYAFLRTFAIDLAIIYNTNPAYKDLRKEWNNAIPFVLDKIDSISTSLERMMLYTDLYLAHDQRNTGFYEDRFDIAVPDIYLKDQMKRHRLKSQIAFQEFDLLKKLKEYNVDASLKSRLISLLESEKENFVYIDFWGNWCGPCMQEMPVYPEFMSKLKDKKIKFLFFGVETPDAEAIKIKDQFRIDGNFITLTSSEVSILNNLLSFSSYPKHTLLKPGSIVSGYAGGSISMGKYLNPNAVKNIEPYLAGAQ